MIVFKKNSLFILFLLVASSTNLDAAGSSWLSYFRSFFTSLMAGRPIFKKPTLNKHWVGIGALAITGSIFAWKYFKNNKANTNDPELTKAMKDLEDLKKSKASWTTLENTNVTRQENEGQEDSAEKLVTADNSNQKESLDDADDEYLSTTTENQFNVGDIVQIINDHSSIEMAPDDMKEYDRLLTKKGFKDRDYSVNNIYKNRIAIIREKNKDKIKIEMESRLRNGQSTGFSGYFAILPKDIKKMGIQADAELAQNNTYVKVELPPKTVKQDFHDYFSYMNDNKNSYDENFDGQTHYIGIVKTIDLKNKRAWINCCFHWREFSPPSTSFEVPISKIFSIYNPDTNQPIIIK